MHKKNSYKKIINEIISNGSPAAIVFTESNGNTVAFFSELNNFFKKSYWMNPTCDDFYSFAVTFAKKVFADNPEEFAKLLQFKHCEYGFNKDSIIIKEALKKIASIYEDCLFVLDNLEKLTSDFDLKIIEYLLQNSPRNLKMLLVSRDFLNINYNIFSEQCPKLIELNRSGKDFSPKAELTADESDLLLYTSSLRFLDREFLSEMGENHLKIMDDIAKKCPEYVLRRGSGYCVNEMYGKNIPDKAEIDKKAKEDYYAYLRKHGLDMQALIFALRYSDKSMISAAVTAIENAGVYAFELCNFVKANRDNLPVLDEEDIHQYAGLEFLYGMRLYYSGKYPECMDICKNVAKICERNSKFEIDCYYMVMKCLAKLHRFHDLTAVVNSLIKERMVKKTLNVEIFETVLCKLPEFLKAGDIPANRENCRFVENSIIKEEYKDRYWYAKALQTAAELHFDWGNYGRATDYIKMLQEHIPFYTIPYRLMGFYYYMGDMMHAISMAKKALAEELHNNIGPDLVELYTLLSKTSVYFNKYNEGLEYIDKAISSVPKYESSTYIAYTLRAIICSKMGRRDYAKDYAMLYAKYAEVNSPNNACYLYGAVAYCAFKLNDLDTASFYANKCIKGTNSRSPVWLIAVAVAINVLLTKEEIATANGLMEKLFRSCRVYGMHAIVLDYYECFEKLFKYARTENIDVDYVDEIEDMHHLKQRQISANGELCVKLMGMTSVTVAGKELNWKTRKAKELFLMYVFSQGKGLDRNFLLSTLWPDYVYVSAINNLKTTNNIIRNILNSANVIHKLEYYNGKYSLVLSHIHCDYTAFEEKLKAFEEAETLKKKVYAAKELLNAYTGDFAQEINLSFFRKYGEHLKEKIMLDVINLICELIDKKDYIEARRLISIATKVDANNAYSALLTEQEKRITDFFEGK